VRDKQYAEARQAYESGLRELEHNPKAPPNQASYHLRLGQVCDLLQDRPAAISHYEKVLSYADPSSQEQARKYLKNPYRRVETAANESHE
jgi:tetratricopeptide (TPR) repeat protein